MGYDVTIALLFAALVFASLGMLFRGIYLLVASLLGEDECDNDGEHATIKWYHRTELWVLVVTAVVLIVIAISALH